MPSHRAIRTHVQIPHVLRNYGTSPRRWLVQAIHLRKSARASRNFLENSSLNCHGQVNLVLLITKSTGRTSGVNDAALSKYFANSIRHASLRQATEFGPGNT
jgi:hypothetical protein